MTTPLFASILATGPILAPRQIAPRQIAPDQIAPDQIALGLIALGLILILTTTLANVTTAQAQDLAWDDMLATDSCLAAEGTRDSCVGASARLCMDTTEGGQGTLGMDACLASEWQAWDARLNDAYQWLMQQARRNDSANASDPPSQADALQAMQRSWIAFRDAQCAFERSLWGGGTGGGPASAACMMTATARQTLYLESQLEAQ